MKHFKVIMQNGVGGCVFSYQIEYTDKHSHAVAQILAMKL